ncbi:MAG: hypothetical protein ISS77_02540 [Phycisphaerae bacterium]|nr:hypothetical protein [Planctomycetota bacterium]MBL7106474.1 hypothetical protein [Phycisphaerae bacterium]
MNRELFFIPILQKALNADNTMTALKEAFCEINRLGKEDKYRQGFDNFRLFLEEFCSHDNFLRAERSEDLKSYPQILSIANQGLDRKLIIFRNNRMLETLTLNKKSNYRIGKIIAGTYTVKLSTGRVLWEGRLTENDLLIEMDGKDENIRLAADSEKSQPVPPRSIKLLDGMVILRIFAGFKAGTLQIELK